MSWGALAGACSAIAAVTIALRGDDRASGFEALAVLAAVGAVYGVLRNRPDRRSAWLCFAFGLALIVAGDIVADIATRAGGGSTGYPWADILYLTAYPVLGVGIYQIADHSFRRDTLVDSAIVTLAITAMMWQWVIAPIVRHAHGPTMEQIVTVTYPVLDILLVVVIVHAMLTVTRWSPAAAFLCGGMIVMLGADIVFARLIADGAYTANGLFDALWPTSYFLLGAAALHPSMREMWRSPSPNVVRHTRVRVLFVGMALFSIPVVVAIEGSGGGETIAMTLVVGVTAGIVAWRVAHLMSQADRAHEVLTGSEARFRAFVQRSTDVIGVIDASGVITYVSPSVSEVFGYDPSEVLGHVVMEFIHPDDVDKAVETVNSLAERPLASESVEFRYRHANGIWSWVQATCTNQMYEPAVRGIVGNMRDVTKRKRIEILGAREADVLRRILADAPLFETMHDLLVAAEEYLMDASATIRLVDAETGGPWPQCAPTLPAPLVDAIDQQFAELVNEAEQAFGTRRDAFVLRDLDVADSRSTIPAVRRHRALARSLGYKAFWSFPIRTPDDARLLGILTIYVHNARTPSAAEQVMTDRVRNIVSVALDRAAHTRQLGHLAHHDALTELPNRALAVQRLDAALDRLGDGVWRADASGDSSDAPMVAVLFVDLDRFKVVNDGLGHDAGDELLVAVGHRLAMSVRRGDTVARFGGDEFVVICEHLTDVHQVEDVADRAITALGEPFVLAGTDVVVTASIGIAITRRSSDRAANLLRDADAAMYRAKSRGGSRYELFDQAMHTEAIARLLTERGLREAIERDELLVLFQPQFDLASGEHVAHEALLRWMHPVRGLVLPGEFIDVAEETSLIVPIGRWVLEQACEHANRSRRGGPDHSPLVISVNVSARQLLRPDFADAVGQIISAQDVDPAMICLEVAEQLLVDDQDATGAALNALKDLGVRLAIDDFGTGGSSLNHLRRYPFDELKIDETFVAGLGRSAADDAIVAATINMAHALGMTVTAEGVETEVQRLRLVEFGCDRAQGYHLAPPQARSAPHLKLVEQQTA
jgi:diguanylate cyclase (GGDEF)-like protein/PAS domain S-box-containing protein